MGTLRLNDGALYDFGTDRGAGSAAQPVSKAERIELVLKAKEYRRIADGTNDHEVVAYYRAKAEEIEKSL